MEGNGKEEDIDKRIDEALECPCVGAADAEKRAKFDAYSSLM